MPLNIALDISATQGWRHMSIRISDALYEAVEREACTSGRSWAEVMRTALQEYVVKPNEEIEGKGATP